MRHERLDLLRLEPLASAIGASTKHRRALGASKGIVDAAFGLAGTAGEVDWAVAGAEPVGHAAVLGAGVPFWFVGGPRPRAVKGRLRPPSGVPACSRTSRA